MIECAGAAISLWKCLTLVGRDLYLFLSIFPLALLTLIAPVLVLVSKEELLHRGRWKMDQGELLPVEHFCSVKFSMVDREHVALLNCSICSQFSTKLELMRNFKPAFIDGSSNIRISAVKDHAATDMHAYAMN